MVSYEFRTNVMMDFTLQIISIIQKRLNSRLYKVLESIEKNAIAVNIILIMVLSVLTIVLWKLFIKNFQNRIMNAKIVLKIFPKFLINSNSKIKRFLNQTCSAIVIN